MNLAMMLLLVIWVSFVVFLIGGWAIKSTFEQINDIRMDDDDIRNIM